jgi:hypothetical protein
LRTWKVSGSNEVNETDNVLISLRHSTSITDVQSSRGPNSDTNHYLVKSKIREEIANIQKKEGVNPNKWDIWKLQESKEINQNIGLESEREYVKTEKEN